MLASIAEPFCLCALLALQNIFATFCSAIFIPFFSALMSRLIFESCFIKKINLKRIYGAEFKLNKRNTSVINSDSHSKCPFGTLSSCKWCARSNKHSFRLTNTHYKIIKLCMAIFFLYSFNHVLCAVFLTDTAWPISTHALLHKTKDASIVMSELHRFVVRKIAKPSSSRQWLFNGSHYLRL